MKISGKKIINLSLCTAFLLHTNLFAEKKQTENNITLEKITVVDQRDNRESTGATGLALDIKYTPQSISTISSEEMAMHGATSSNQAIEMMTGINVEEYETNRAIFNSRGFEIQLTQIDGMGTTNDYGVVVGQQDTFLFEKIELIRGANGLLTGVGNSSGTINYVRKRPLNKDQGLINLSGGSYNNFRGAIDYNKVFTENGNWAGRIVMTKESKESHIRDLKNDRTTIYGVIDGQIGNDGVLTIGSSYSKNNQDSPMWGSLTLNYLNGTYADFPISASTSANWTYWDTINKNAFIEYLHQINDSWVAKVSYNWNSYDSESKLLYGYVPGGGLADNNAGIIGWPYFGFTEKDSKVLDVNINGEFNAFGQTHTLLAGINYTDEGNTTYTRNVISGGLLPYPNFNEYNGETYTEPVWGNKEKRGDGNKKLTRLYLASRLGITQNLNAIVGANIIKLEREGSSIYGDVPTQTKYPDLKEASPYFGLTYDISDDTLLYASYSNIFQNQDNVDYYGKYLDPMEGVNYEIGIKSEFFDKKLLTTIALFNAEQNGLAVTSDEIGINGQSFSIPIDVESKGIEIEALGKIGDDTRIGIGLTHLKMDGEQEGDIVEWIPRTTVNIRFNTGIKQIPGLKVGMKSKWRSNAYKNGGAKQDAFFTADAFAAYKVSKQATLRLNINNVFDKKYIQGLVHGAVYGKPRTAKFSLEYKF